MLPSCLLRVRIRPVEAMQVVSTEGIRIRIPTRYMQDLSLLVGSYIS